MSTTKSETDEKARQLKLLQAKSQQQFAYIQSVYDLAQRANDANKLALFKRKVGSIKFLRQEFLDLQEKVNLLEIEINPGAVPSFTNMDTVNDMFGYISHVENKFVASGSTVASGSSVTGAGSTISDNLSNSVKLSPLELPTFGGSVSDWPMFHQIFRINIHENQSLSKAHKLQYLLSKLQGRGLSVCAGIPPTEENYDVIWERLVDKYEDQRSLAAYYMEQICNVKPIRNEGANQLGSFADKMGATVAALKALKVQDLGEFILFYLIQSKLDDNTRRLFEESLASKEIPKIDNLLEFVQKQAKILVRLQPMSEQRVDNFGQYKSKQWNQPKPGIKPKVSHSFHVKESMQCVLCKNNHVLEKCNLFLKLSPQERYRVVKANLLCVNCISNNHKATNCNLSSECNICNLNHHSLLHFPQGKNNFNKSKSYQTISTKPKVNNDQLQQGNPSSCVGNVGISNQEAKEAAKSANVFSSVCANSGVQNNMGNEASTVLLSTVKVNVQGGDGQFHTLRFLMDSGSMCNLITEPVCKQLKLDVGLSKTMLSGIGSNANPVQGQVQFKLSSILDDRTSFVIKALVVDNIVDELPVAQIDCSHLDYLDNLELADDEFMNPGPVAGIIGAPIYAYLLTGKSVSRKGNEPVAMGTKLGFVIMGNAPILPRPSSTEKKELCMFQKSHIETQLEKFWELDQVVDCSFSKLTPAEQDCENHFVDHVTRDVTGRYVVSLPFSEDSALLGDSFSSAKRRFLNLEKRLISNPDAHAAYARGIQELIDNGYMAKVENQLDKSGYFIPHHTVFKPDSVSTKQRIVFDASAKTSSGRSLNDILHSGPKLYSDLFGILLNFRLFSWALNGDITKMFLQILVNQDDCKFQRLIWRFDPSETLTSYEMKVVIFGMRCSPFLAQRTVQQLVSDEIANYPCASGITNFLYMDDCVASFPTETEVVLFYQDVVKLFHSGGFTFAKWISNSNQVMDIIPESERLTKLVSFDNENNVVKILGMCWNASNDFLYFKISETDKPCTKRGILSTVLSIYDPLGLLGPLVLWVKLLIRELCILKLDWDTTPPQNIVELWLLFKNQLVLLEGLKFPRHLGVGLDCVFQLVGFCDASQRGYGAVIYSRVQLKDGSITVQLVCAKSKVAPLKVETIPRLELCSLLLLSKLMKSVIDTYSVKYKMSGYFGLTDSTVALCWVHGSPLQWNVFVANRVSKIQNNLDCKVIYHIPGTDNPADSLSRGEMPAQFVENEFYRHGPLWLSQEISSWPITSYSDLKIGDVPEGKHTSVFVATEEINSAHPLKDLVLRASSWSKLLKTVTYILKFLRKLPSGGSTSVDGLEAAERFILKYVQQECFSSEIENIEKNGECGKTLKKLSPFLEQGILRVGGRLSNSNLPNDQQHPILLPSNHHVTELIVTHCHTTNFHTGPFLLLAILRQKFWIVGGRNLVRKLVQKCNVCFKFNPRFNNPKMGAILFFYFVGIILVMLNFWDS
ncbi:uncharacterized protein LOC103518638 isoform X2 [Diaphorina citri]|uniref:Uncharacterized protein LOC103518638 isoform X2 n=1 Tax=Diaphorina citri TaxID=121845 RepID=A0A3Q0JCL2_DIACI|nr:uncharacterized protein LOC103518638 isoform X2 [Diaphorina citri]